MDYAKEKLKFVSHLNGTNLSDVTVFLSTIPMINGFSFMLKMFVIFNIYKESGRIKKKFSLLHLVLFDFLFHVIPLVLIATLFSTWLNYIQFGYTILILIVYKSFNKVKTTDTKDEELTVTEIEDIRSLIVKYTFSSFRTMVYVLTSVSILAVDFNIFPRRYAKTETYGVSLMDIGVGAFVVGHSLKSVQTTANEDFAKTAKGSSFLVIMGLMRLISVKATGYVEHISEYGVHWNFFFTLAIVKTLSCPFQLYIRRNPIRAFAMAFMFSTAYQYVLTKQEFSSYILQDYTPAQIKNLNLYQANKEGLFSCLGYFALYFAGQSISLYVTSKTKENSKSIYTPFLKAIGALLFLANLFYTGLQLSKHFLEDVSRRLCNISFICLVLMLTCLYLTMSLSIVLVVVNTCSKMNKTWKETKKLDLLSQQLDYIFSYMKIIDSKYIGLFIFILSNILTGLVNLTIQTIYVNTVNSLLILFIYMLVNILASYYIYFYLNTKSSSKKSN